MNTKTKKFTVISTILFIIICFVYKHLKEPIKPKLEGTWITKDTVEDNYKLNFFTKDSLELSQGNERLILSYSLESNELKLLKDGSLNKFYLYKQEGDTLLLKNTDDELMLFKVK